MINKRVNRRIKKRKKKLVYQKIMKSQGYYKPSARDFLTNTLCSITYMEKPINSSIKLIVMFLHCIALISAITGIYSVVLASKDSLKSEEINRVSLAYDTNKPSFLRENAIQWLLDNEMTISGLILNDFSGRFNSYKFTGYSEGLYRISNLVFDNSSIDLSILNAEVKNVVLKDSGVGFYSEYIELGAPLLNRSNVYFNGVGRKSVATIYTNCIQSSGVKAKNLKSFLFIKGGIEKYSLTGPLGKYMDSSRRQCSTNSGNVSVDNVHNAMIDSANINRVRASNSKNVDINYILGFEVRRSQGGRYDTYNMKSALFQNVEYSVIRTSRHVKIEVVNSRVTVKGKVFDRTHTELFPFASIMNSKRFSDIKRTKSSILLEGNFAVVETELENIDLRPSNKHFSLAVLVIKNSSKEDCNEALSLSKKLKVKQKNIFFIDNSFCKFGVNTSEESWKIASREVSHDDFIDGTRIMEEKLSSRLKMLF